MILTTDKPLASWGKVQGEDLAQAIVDRVIERGRLLTLDGPSMRTKHRRLDEPAPKRSNHGVSSSARITFGARVSGSETHTSFNVAVPRHGTRLRKHAKDQGLIGDLRVMDQAGHKVAMPTRHLSREEVMKLKRKAVFRFYLRPAFLWRRLTSVSSFSELLAQVREGAARLSRTAGIGSGG